MKLKNEFIVYNTGDEAMLVPTGEADFHGILRGNKTVGAVLELLQNDTTEEAIIAAMRQHFKAPEGAIERGVAKIVDGLREIGAIDE